jgi:hypothetical protein
LSERTFRSLIHLAGLMRMGRWNTRARLSQIELKGSRMRMQRMALACALSIAATAAWSQEYRGTWEQQMACTPDVWRLCSDQVPDVSRIVACLRANTPQLSNNCRVVFESNANAPPTDTARAAPQTQPRTRAAPPTRPPATQRPNNPWYDDE